MNEVFSMFPEKQTLVTILDFDDPAINLIAIFNPGLNSLSNPIKIASWIRVPTALATLSTFS